MFRSRSSGTTAGNRVPFVLIHGLVSSSLYMIPLAERIAVEHEVRALDLPGFGRSDSPSEVLTVPQLADWVIAWMSATGLRQCHLVANSLGCRDRGPSRGQSAGTSRYADSDWADPRSAGLCPGHPNFPAAAGRVSRAYPTLAKLDLRFLQSGRSSHHWHHERDVPRPH